MNKKLSILITGCSTGIGYYCAMQLKQRGYRVFATARKATDVEMLKQQGLEAFQLDLDCSDSIHQAFDQILTLNEGKLDALFNNGAYGQPGAVEDLTRDTMRKQFETNLFGTMELTNLAVKVMRQQGSGRIIQNSSVLGLVALPFRGAYNASKFALEGLTDTLRMELSPTDIKVCLIEPGPIESKFRENALKALHDNVDYQQSALRDNYQAALDRLSAAESSNSFCLPPQAVYKALLHALEANRPKARYYVTTPTYMMGFLRRILPTRLLDRILYASSDET